MKITLRLNIFKVINIFFLVAIIFASVDFSKSNTSGNECAHTNYTFGRLVYGQWLANSTIINKPASWLGKVTVKVRFPPYGSGIKANISQVQILNLYKKCDCFWEDAKIISGGIGKPYAEVSVTSAYHCQSHHQFLFFNSTRRY